MKPSGIVRHVVIAARPVVNQRAPRNGRGNQTKTVVKAADATVADVAATKVAGAYPRVAPAMLPSANAVVLPKTRKIRPSRASGAQRYTTAPSSANSPAPPANQTLTTSVSSGG